MDLGIKNKRALVLGASRGLGLGIATALCREGVNVAICGRNEERLIVLSKELSKLYGTEVIPIAADLFLSESDTIIGDKISRIFGSVDILVNNTGGPPMLKATNVTKAQWTEYFDMMMLRVISITNQLLPAMCNQNWGRVLNVVSSGVVQPIEGLVLSNVLRSALVTWGKTLSFEVASRGVTINSLMPGKIQTERLKQLNKSIAARLSITAEEANQRVLSRIPVGRYGSVEEFSEVAVFIASERASYITGSIIRVDGGMIEAV